MVHMSEGPAAVFRLDNQRLAFRFTATVFDRAGAALERLTSPDRLRLWFEANGLDFGAVTSGDLTQAKALREHIHQAGIAVAAQEPIAVADLRALNSAARRGNPRRMLDGEAARWRGNGVDDALAVIAGDAIEVLGGPDRGRVKACADENCQGLYVDTSRAENRRWCNMNTCGNRAKKAAMSRLREERGV